MTNDQRSEGTRKPLSGLNEAKTALDAALIIYRAGFVPLPVAWKSKKAIDPEWTSTKYTSEAEVIAKFKDKRLNVGILCRGIVCLDIDSPEANDAVWDAMPHKNGCKRRGSKPYDSPVIELTDGTMRTKHVKLDEETPYMDVLSEGTQFVAWGYHPSGARYTVVSLPPYRMSCDEVRAIVRQVCERLGIGDVYAEVERLRPINTNSELDALIRSIEPEHVGLKEGNQPCKLHNHTTPNGSELSVFRSDDDVWLYKCHGRDDSGNLLQFAQTQNGWDFQTAKQHFLERFSLPKMGGLFWGSKLEASGTLAYDVRILNNFTTTSPYLPTLPIFQNWKPFNDVNQYELPTLPISGLMLRVGGLGFQKPPIGGGSLTTPPTRDFERLGNMFNNTPPKAEPIAGTWLYRKNLSILSGESDAGKTFFCLALGASLSCGAEFLGKTTQQGTVLYLNEEMDVPEVNRRMRLICAHFTEEQRALIEENFRFSNFGGWVLSERTRDEFSEILEKHKPSLVIVDSLRRVLVGNENSSEDINELTNRIIRPLMKAHDCAFLIIAHPPKPTVGAKGEKIQKTRFRGSGALVNDADSAIYLETIAKNRRVLDFERFRLGMKPKPQALAFKFDEGRSFTISSEGEYDLDKDSITECENRIREYFQKEKGEVSNSVLKMVIAKYSNKNYFDAARDRMIKRGELVRGDSTPNNSYLLRHVAVYRGDA